MKLADFGFATRQKISSSRKGTAGYMAPEVLDDQDYDSRLSDIFSAGTVLFIMMTQFCPFINANKSDRYYSKIMTENWDKLWEMYETSNTSDVDFSPEFRDLFQHLVCYKPKDRMLPSELKNHAWFSGPIATPQEIFDEFTHRKLVRDSKLAQSENNDKEMKTSQKSGESEETEEDKSVKAPEARPVISKEDKRYTKFFKVSDPEELVNAIVEFAMAREYSFEKSEEFYRIELRVVEAGETALITVNVLKKPEDDSRCIQFIRTSGSKLAFMAAFTYTKIFLAEKSDLN